jgi:hypothetical protein
MKFYSGATILFVVFFIQSGRAQSPTSIILEMIESAAKIEGFTAEITKEERIDGEMIKQITDVKLIREPYQVYLVQRFPKEGVEILCEQGADRPLINPNSFPWFNLSLDPYGSLMRRNQHHTVFDSGFDLMNSILSRELKRIGQDTAAHIFYKGIIDWQGKPAYHIELTNPKYHIASYKVKSDEDLNTIARELNISEYAILELNEDVDFFDDVSTGQNLQVPSRYAKKMVLYIDKEYMLPLGIKVYDDKGLFEQYAYRNFILNPDFDKGEFTSEYQDYGF